MTSAKQKKREAWIAAITAMVTLAFGQKVGVFVATVASVLIGAS